MEREELNKQYKKGIIAGFITGSGIFLAIGMLAVAFVASYFFTRDYEYNVGEEFVIGEDVVRKSNEIIGYIDENFLYEYDEEAMENAIYKAILSSMGDKYSCYYTEEEFNKLMEETEGTYNNMNTYRQYYSK